MCYIYNVLGSSKNSSGSVQYILLVIFIIFLIVSGIFYYFFNSNLKNQSILVKPAIKNQAFFQQPSASPSPSSLDSWIPEPTPSIPCLRNDVITLSKDKPGWCSLTTDTYEGFIIHFSLIFPQQWEGYSGAGADNGLPGAYFITDPEISQILNYGVILTTNSTQKPLDQAYQDTYCFEQSCYKFVENDEITVSKKNKTIGEKNTLVLTTKKNDTYNIRYFFEYTNNRETPVLFTTLVKLSQKDLTDPKNQELLNNIETLISSIKIYN